MADGLKSFRSGYGPADPNSYWHRKDAKRCKKCYRRIRGENHEEGGHHNGKFSAGGKRRY